MRRDVVVELKELRLHGMVGARTEASITTRTMVNVQLNARYK